MEPKIIKTKDYIEFIGHYDDIAKCAKLSALASLYAIESKVGYAKFPIKYEQDIYKALNCSNIFADTYTNYYQIKNGYDNRPIITVYLDFNNLNYVQMHNGSTIYDKNNKISMYFQSCVNTNVDNGYLSFIYEDEEDYDTLWNQRGSSYTFSLQGNFDVYMNTGYCDIKFNLSTNNFTNDNKTGYGSKINVTSGNYTQRFYDGDILYLANYYGNKSTILKLYIHCTQPVTPGIYSGSAEVTDLFVGNERVLKVYAGDKIAYEYVAPPTHYNIHVEHRCMRDGYSPDEAWYYLDGSSTRVEITGYSVWSQSQYTTINAVQTLSIQADSSDTGSYNLNIGTTRAGADIYATSPSSGATVDITQYLQDNCYITIYTRW